MKKLFLVLATFIGTQSIAQTESGVFVDFGLGTRFGGITTETTTMDAGFHFNGGLGYMFSNKFGVKGDIGFNNFRASDVNEEGIYDRSGSVRASLQAILSISEIANFGTEGFGLNFHTGFGFGTIFNPDYKDAYLEVNEEFGDPMIKGNDDVVNIIFGLTPRFPINEKLAVTVDFSHVLYLKQDHYYDRRYSNAQLESGARGFTTASVGLSIRF